MKTLWFYQSVLCN